MNFGFNVLSKSEFSNAHCGQITTPHGIIETPAFIFCATQGAIKGAIIKNLEQEGIQFILGNTYHLWLQPGPNIIEKHGSLHNFIGWKGPMLTDSGGFQIFSLGHGGVVDEIKCNRSDKSNKNNSTSLLKLTEEGAIFRSYLDGQHKILTPEKSIDIQQKLGADFVLPLDECTPFHKTKLQTKLSMDRSHRWEKRSLNQFYKSTNGNQRIYGIVQGGIYEDLRCESADFVNNEQFFGNAIGGSLGGQKQQMYEVVDFTMKQLLPSRPTHLLGIGGLRDILEGVNSGIDTFDCVHPTRIARHGCALIANPEEDFAKEHLNLKNSIYREDLKPIDNNCKCYTCRNFTRAYIHHLLKAKESASGMLLIIHNVRFMVTWMQKIRDAIKAGNWEEFYKKNTKQIQ